MRRAGTTHKAGNESDYWLQVRNVLAQFKGVYEGYNKECAHTDT